MNFMRLKSLLKYVGIPEVVSISEERTHQRYCSHDFLAGLIHPKGT